MNATNEIRTAENTFPHLLAAYIAEREAQTANTLHFIRFGYMPTWAEEHRTDADRGIRTYATAHTWEQYQRGEIDRQTAAERAEKRYIKAEQKKLGGKITILDIIASSPDVEFFDISVEWKRSATWGYNPTATAYIRTVNGARVVRTGHASGCGYDKRSAAVAEALNSSNSVLKLLYTYVENALANGETFDTENNVVSWRSVLGYGSGYGVLPYFEGGVGVSCFWHILEKCGFWTRSNESEKHNDYYFIGKEN